MYGLTHHLNFTEICSSNVPVFIFHPIKKAAERPIVMLQCVMAVDCLERLEVPAFLTFQKPERI